MGRRRVTGRKEIERNPSQFNTSLLQPERCFLAEVSYKSLIENYFADCGLWYFKLIEENLFICACTLTGQKDLWLFLSKVPSLLVVL